MNEELPCKIPLPFPSFPSCLPLRPEWDEADWFKDWFKSILFLREFPLGVLERVGVRGVPSPDFEELRDFEQLLDFAMLPRPKPRSKSGLNLLVPGRPIVRSVSSTSLFPAAGIVRDDPAPKNWNSGLPPPPGCE